MAIEMEKRRKVARAVRLMAEKVDEAFGAFNHQMSEDFPDGFHDTDGWLTLRMHLAEGAVASARDYLKARARDIDPDTVKNIG